MNTGQRFSQSSRSRELLDRTFLQPNIGAYAQLIPDFDTRVPADTSSPAINSVAGTRHERDRVSYRWFKTPVRSRLVVSTTPEIYGRPISHHQVHLTRRVDR